ncbi:MAG: hypothetical protein AAF431_00335 [Pseudomonadota bacterium]
MAVSDRLQQLVEQNQVAGIDFVDVESHQTTLNVVFFSHDANPQADQILASLTIEDIEIYAPFGADNLPQIEVGSMGWQIMDDRTVLTLKTLSPGDFSQYRLRLSHTRIDHYFNDVSFSFKANCPSELDCEPIPSDCDTGELIDFPVNYLARDFSSYRQALFEFASQRYPQWEDRLEADKGVMVAEVIAALGDELAFYQDQVSREAYLETAAQRRSINRHARLVDYWPHQGLGASGWLVVEAPAGKSGLIDAGYGVAALSDTGNTIEYEIGTGLQDKVDDRKFAVDAVINRLLPHCWDEDDNCLPRGATSMFVQGHVAARLAFDDPPFDPTGKWLVISSDAANGAPCPHNHLIRITQVRETRDEIIGQDITEISWSDSQAVESEMPYEPMVVHGNVVPVTAGRTHEHRFVIGEDVNSLGLPAVAAETVSPAVSRQGNNDNTQYYLTLPDPAEDQLVFLDRASNSKPHQAQPEIVLQEVSFTDPDWVYEGSPWEWRRSLLGVNSSQSNDRHFCLEDGSWGRLVGYWRDGEEKVFSGYQADIGKTVCFGNGEFGRVPAQSTLFSIRYRLGNGVLGNVAPGAITHLQDESDLIESVFNPFALENGRARESREDVKQFAPHAFRAKTFRAVRKEDYAEAAERLEWVQRAGAAERWTGSWLTTFVTPDPLSARGRSSSSLDESQVLELNQQMQRFRQAGREVSSNLPRFADIDLLVRVCVQPTSFAGDVKRELLALLVGKDRDGIPDGYFSDHNFTFGTPLRRAQLEAIIHQCPGVRAVLDVQIRRRGQFVWREFSELTFAVGMDEVIRIDNDPIHPGRGSLKLEMEGGA